MFDIGMPEMIVIFVVALLVIGPKKLPEVAKALGKGLGELKKSFQDVKDSVEEEFKDSTSDIRDAVTDFKKQIETEATASGKVIQKTMEDAQEQVEKEAAQVSKAVESDPSKDAQDAKGGPENK
ncbi:MAG TPA: Sec-independent protein translocase protein TatB [Thermodesulfovibrionales bacterium]|nr:Sec-independent protein translocase protein TatB [Thermodesulfovibrionales bacterium]